MGSARILGYFGDETDPASNAPAAVATASSAGSAPSNGPLLRLRYRAFDASTDETVQLAFVLPSNYSSGGTLVFKWSAAATSGNVVWKTAYVLLHPSSEGTPTDWDAASFGTVTAQTAVAVPGTAGVGKESSFDLGVTGGHAGDILMVLLGRDADNASDTAAGDAYLWEPWLLSFTTT